MLAASGSKTKVVQDPVVLRLQSLQETYSASAVEAARIALGIPAEEIHAKEDFTNKYDAKLTDPSEFRKEYVPEDRSPRLKQRKKELWNFKRELHLDAIEDVLTGHRNAPMPKLRETGQKRYHLAQQQVGEGGDISSPPAPDMSEFDAAMAIRNQQIKEEFEKRQAKRAELMIQAIADSERKMQYAEQKARESKARLDAYKKELKVAQKEKAKAIQERMQACLNAAAAAHKAHMAEARETYNKLVSRLDRAQTYRDNKLDPTALKASSDKSLAMTQHRLKNAKDKMSRTCDELQHRQALADKKLAEQKEEIRLKIEAQIVAAQEKFAKIQADVQETLERQAKERLEKHENFGLSHRTESSF
ncbi:unnamed protein product [Amoebophrya sp. A25]|nr:unnamed protein product [Amoebophrya sp. A25]|eukprot:GSA25T00024209001.1